MKLSHLPRVMISSTARDLGSYRRAVMDACLSVNVFPSMMENLPASKADAIDASIRMVDGADIYIGLFANRYGYIPDGNTISITEMEYWHALERGIPILIYILEDGIGYEGMEQLPPEPATSTEQLTRFKDHLKTKHVVNFFRSSDDLRAHVLKGLWHVIHEAAGAAPVLKAQEKRDVSDQLRKQFSDLNQRISSLTEDQYQVLNLLRYYRRISVAGCAGSGKTLVAVQKAILLDKAGLRTLIVCHSRNLAAYIRTLVNGTGITVFDFTSWVNQLIGQGYDTSTAWSQYEEPTEDELSTAFDNLLASNQRYEAIIVDEGQDFREEWWLIVEAALISPEYGTLYIFHDDNQALLPFRSTYPVTAAPVILSKNCRNAGEIYEVVRLFHPQSPEPSVSLKGEGIVKRWLYWADEASPIEAAVIDMLTLMPPEKIVVLTTEPEPVEDSVLYNAVVELPPTKKWQDFLAGYLRNYGHFSLTLSSEPLPTKDDIEAVREFARSVYPKTWPSPKELRSKNPWRWKETEQGFSITGDQRLAKFTFEDWAVDLPLMEGQKFVLSNEKTGRESALISLYTVSSYKGLEADGVVLFIPTRRPDLESLVYVGASRAKLALYIVTERHASEQVRHVLPIRSD